MQEKNQNLTSERLKDREFTKKNFLKRGLKYRGYAKKHNLVYPILQNIIVGKNILFGKTFAPNSPTKRIVEQLVKDNIWVGPIPDEMKINPLVDFHKGAGLGAFDKDNNLIINIHLFNYIKVDSTLDNQDLFLVALVDAYSMAKGYTLESDETFARYLGLNPSQVEELIHELWMNAWLQIETRGKSRAIKVTEAGAKNGK